MASTHGTSALKHDRRYTLDEWRHWEGRWELILGAAWAMSPAPSPRHQEVVGDLFVALAGFLRGSPCKAYVAPIDVYLEEFDDATTVVQPDVLVVCDPALIQGDGIHGAPDFIAEVLSESTATKDLGVKPELYERVGVREYWIVHPETGAVVQYARRNDRLELAREWRQGEKVRGSLWEAFTWAIQG